MEWKITLYHYNGFTAKKQRTEIGVGGVYIDHDGSVTVRGRFSLEEATRQASALAGENVQLICIYMFAKGTFGAPVDLPALLARHPMAVSWITESAVIVFFFPGNAQIEATGAFDICAQNEHDMRERLCRMIAMIFPAAGA